MIHTWKRDVFSQTQRKCERCGCVELECERNTESQSTATWFEYWRGGQYLISEPECVASHDVAPLIPHTQRIAGFHGERWCFVGVFTRIPDDEWIEVVW